jgi:hydroxypyruvate reductase
MVKGGQLAGAAYPAKTLSFAISDVPGDDPAIIASGPTVGDASTAQQAIEILTRYRIEVPEAVYAHLQSDACETPFSGDICLSKAEMHVLATPMKSLQAAAEVARKAGYNPVILGDALEGESRALAAEMAEIAKTSAPQTALISGGETTVIVRGTGKGGRNAEFIHALALQGAFFGLAADTVGMARSMNPDSGDSQFFICFDGCGHLTGQYTVWGQVSRGMDVVHKINAGEPPAEPDSIVSASLAE